MLIVAEDGDELVAGALNLIGGDTLFGRLWGCLPHAYFPNLHFEACYYQVNVFPRLKCGMAAQSSCRIWQGKL